MIDNFENFYLKKKKKFQKETTSIFHFLSYNFLIENPYQLILLALKIL